MKQDECSAVLISDFTVEVLARYFTAGDTSFRIFPVVKKFSEEERRIRERGVPAEERYDIALIWNLVERVSPAFREMLSFRNCSRDEVFADVDAYAQIVFRCSESARAVFVPSLVLPTYRRGYGMLEYRRPLGAEEMLARMNLRLSEGLAGVNNVYMLNTRQWIERAGREAFSPKLWYMCKVPFGGEVFKACAQDIVSAMRGILGRSRKMVVLDLDGTLWGGDSGDLGVEHIRLGGHDPAGEAFRDFQFTLKSLTNRGVMLAALSKNDESVALDVLERHPEMVLRTQDFAGVRINWRDKAVNLAEMAEELRLGLESVVFLDNDPVERARIRDVFPQVYVPEMPSDPLLFPSFLLGLSCFDTPTVTREDSGRIEWYKSEVRRKMDRRPFSSLDEWLPTLGIRVKVEMLDDVNIMRAVQLMNKTHQMNLSTRRLTESELREWVEAGEREVFVFSAADKFGDAGIVGILGLEVSGDAVHITDFVLSCRVLGRKIEEAMLFAVVKYALRSGASAVHARYSVTPRNSVCLEFLKRSGFRQKEGDAVFIRDTRNVYPPPAGISIEGWLL